jgi:energy-coupling factor transport system substrate-specific component
VSWIAGSTLILAVALAAGFVWYERTHPTTRVIALVATLAALATLGRMAFAPLPNVKPTTDIVLIAGYVLGGAPGFTVGAVAALASNLFFGQGPWTPWQMVAWGLVGLGGAALARLSRGRLGRVPLALACGLAGLAFGTIMNLQLWITYSGDHTLAKLITTCTTSLPFDIAHATGNVLFFLAFGPALVRALSRYRTRFEITWAPVAAAGCVALALVGTGFAAAPAPAEAAAGGTAAAPAPAQTPAGGTAAARASSAAARASAVNSASSAYLERAQNADGGWGAAPGQPSSPLYTGWVALGLAAAGRNPANVAKNRSALAYVRAHPGDGSDLGSVERSILVLSAAGVPARDFKGHDLVGLLVAHRRANGSFAGQVNITAFAVLALRAAGRSTHDAVLSRAASWLAGQANSDGGFNFAGRGGQSGIDDTGAAIEALTAAGRRSTATVRRAAAFVVGHQNPDGGFPLLPGAGSNAQSTAWAVQGLLAAGRDPAKVRRGSGRDPLAYLRSLTAASGAIRYSRTSAQTPVWVTGEALMALERRPLPL